MSIPIWAILGIIIAILQAFRPLAQERWRGEAFPVAIMNKVVIACLSLPLVLWQGLPTEWVFYAAIAATSIIWCISDIAYFRAVEKFGAGPISRILPGAIIVSFVLWFAVDPMLFTHYAAQPWISTGIAVFLLSAAFFSSSLSHCEISRNAFRVLWPTFAAATIGPIVMKLILQTAPAGQSVFAYAFVESLIMIAYWTLFSIARRASNRSSTSAFSLGWGDLIAPATLKASAAIGGIMLIVISLRSLALLSVDNPAYVTVLAHTDVLWIVLIYKLCGRQEGGKVAAGLGIAVSAAGLILLKSWV